MHVAARLGLAAATGLVAGAAIGRAIDREGSASSGTAPASIGAGMVVVGGVLADSNQVRLAPMLWARGIGIDDRFDTSGALRGRT